MADLCADPFAGPGAAPLFAHQASAVDFLRRRERAILGDGPGLGKTRASLEAIETPSAVAVVKLSTAEQWRDEIRLWRPDLPVLAAPPRSGERGVFVVHPAKLPRAPGSRAVTGDFTLVLDEVHEYRGLRASIISTLGGYTRLASHVWGLTGTPMYDSAAGLWTLLCLFGWAASFGGNARARFESLVNAGSLSAVMQSRGWMLRRALDDQGQVRDAHGVACGPALPPMTQQWVHLGTPPRGISGATIGEVRADLSPQKAEAVVAWARRPDRIDDLGPCLFFFTHRRGAARAAELLGSRVGLIDGSTSTARRPEILARFTAGDLDHLVLMTQCCGAGLNLTRSRSVLRAETDWSPKAQEQARARVWRIGQKCASVEYVFGFDHWADEHVFELEKHKAAVIADNGF